MTNRYPGTCSNCGGRVASGEGTAFKPKGARRYAVKHTDCDAAEATSYRGRCEDAPCCGHEDCGFGPGAIGYGFYSPVPRGRW